MDTMRRKKDFNYFDYFINCAQKANEAAKFLDKTLRTYDPSTVSSALSDMHKIENDADLLRHQMLEALAREFMTPIEREDIVSLAQELDNVVDAIEDVMQCVYMYNLTGIRPEAFKFTELIVNCTSALLKVTEEFKHFRKAKASLRPPLIEVNNIESEGDQLFVESMHALFAEKTDVLLQLSWTNVYERLEQCLDECEDVVDIIEGVIMKNS